MPNKLTSPSFSVIICSIEAGKFSRVRECYRHLLSGYEHEIIGIHDAKSLAEGYNRGIRQSTGDIIVFSHDDILIIDDAFAQKIATQLQDFDLLGFAGTSRMLAGYWFAAGQPHIHGAVAHARPKDRFITFDLFGIEEWPVVSGIKALDGLCMISTREVAQRIGFDAETFDGFHLYDLDFSFSTWLAGYRVGICADIPLIHESAGNFNSENLLYQERFMLKHGAFLDHIEHSLPSSYLTMGDNTNAERHDLYTSPQGRAAVFLTPDALQRIWQADILLRATCTLRR